MSYTVVSPEEIYRGKTYSDFVADWFNWFISADADKHNSGPVVFLRSLSPSSNSITDTSSENADQNTSPEYEDDPSRPRIYLNNPNLRVGGNRLQIHADQAVLVPVIVAFDLALRPYYDFGFMQDSIGRTIDYGDNPPGPDQLTINNINVEGINMADFRIQTSIFTAVVPDVEHGRSLKDFLEIPAPPGPHPAMVEGYFVLLRFEPGQYYVHAWASGPREPRGPYFSQLMYQIEVLEDREPCPPRTKVRPSRNGSIITRILTDMSTKGEVSPEEARKVFTITRILDERKHDGRKDAKLIPGDIKFIPTFGMSFSEGDSNTPEKNIKKKK